MDPGLAAVARSLRKLPELAKRFEAGEVDAHHGVVTCRHHANARITDTVEREQSQLVGYATGFTYPEFKRLVGHWAQLADEDGADQKATERSARRHARMSRTFDGMWVGDFLLDPPAGAESHTALERIADELYRLDAPASPSDVDHIEPWESGGRTTQENGRLLCPFHNHLRQCRAPRSAA